MASFGLRRAYGLLALLANVNWTVSQTTAPSGVVGYIVEDDAPFSSVTCELPDYQVYPNDDLLFCDATTDYFLATDCVDRSTILYVTTESLESATENTLICSEACTSLTVIQEYPSSGSTWMIYDCLEYMGVPSGVNTIYQTLPSGVPSTTTTTSEESTTTEEGTSTAENSRTTTTGTRSTQTNDPEDSGGSGPNVGVIVGATVGSVAGVALIIAAIFIGIRIGKKKGGAAAAAGAGANGSPAADPNHPVQMVPPHMGMAGSPPLDKYGGPSVVMAHPAQYPPQSYMPYPQQQPIVPQGYYPPQGYHPPEAYSPQPSQPTSSGPPQSTELPTGYAAQGWASSEDHPHPYEMEAMLQPGQRSPRPQ